jgi:menaquinone-9 beta-reductase
VPFRGIRFIVSGLRAEAAFAGEPGRGIRRRTLHRLLVERAEAVGVRLQWQTRALGLIRGGALSDAGPVACRGIIGADGERSQVRRWSASPPAGEVCIAPISRDPRVRLRSLFEVCPELARCLARAPASTPERGAISTSRRLPAVTRGRVALIDEASGSVDATGEGPSPTFQHALALADALSSGGLRSYEASHRRTLRTPAFMVRLLLAMDRSPWLRRRALRAFTVEPGLFSRLLALHVGAFTPLRRAMGSSAPWAGGS